MYYVRISYEKSQNGAQAPNHVELDSPETSQISMGLKWKNIWTASLLFNLYGIERIEDGFKTFPT